MKRTRLKAWPGDYFGTSVSNYKLQDLRRDVSAIGRMKKFGSPELDRILHRLDELSAQFFGLFGEGDRRVAFTGRDAFREDNEEIYSDLLAALDLIGSHLKLLQNPPEEIQPLFRRAMELSLGLRFVLEENDRRYVYWMEKRGRGCFLQATPIDVSNILAEKLFHQVDTIVLTSATLAVSGGFDFVEKRLGVGECAHADRARAFRLSKQALLYVPQDMPEPRSPAFTKAASEASD